MKFQILQVIESNRIKRNRIMFGSTNQGPNILSLYLQTLSNYKASTPLLAKLIFNPFNRNFNSLFNSRF